MIEANSAPVIRASEVGQYAFCARSWWLGRVKGYPSSHVQEMAYGRDVHLAHGRAVVHYQRLQRLAYALLILAAVLAIYSLVRGA